MNATPQQILPAWTHGRSQRVLVDLDQFSCKEGQREDKQRGRKKGDIMREASESCLFFFLRINIMACLILRCSLSPESSCRVLKLSVLSMAVTRRATQIMHDWRSEAERERSLNCYMVAKIFHFQTLSLEALVPLCQFWRTLWPN